MLLSGLRMTVIFSALKNHIYNFKIHRSCFFSFFLIIWSFEIEVFQTRFSFSDFTYFFWTLIGAVAILASVLIHDTGHILCEKAIGIPSSKKIFFPFGCATHTNGNAINYDGSISVAIAGPVASIITASIFHLLYLTAIHEKWQPPIPYICDILTNTNILLTGINILPLPPFDGGIILYNLLIVSKIKKSMDVILFLNKLVFLVLIAFGISAVSKGLVINGIWCILGAISVKDGLQYSTGHLLIRQFFMEEKAGSFLRQNPVTVQENLSLQQFVNQYMYRYHTGIFPVMRQSQLQGYILTSSLKKKLEKSWEDYTVANFTIPCSEKTVINSSTSLLQTIKIMCAQSSSRILVIDYGEISGVVTLKDLLSYFPIKIDTGSNHHAKSCFT